MKICFRPSKIDFLGVRIFWDFCIWREKSWTPRLQPSLNYVLDTFWVQCRYLACAPGSGLSIALWIMTVRQVQTKRHTPFRFTVEIQCLSQPFIRTCLVLLLISLKHLQIIFKCWKHAHIRISLNFVSNIRLNCVLYFIHSDEHLNCLVFTKGY